MLNILKRTIYKWIIPTGTVYIIALIFSAILSKEPTIDGSFIVPVTALLAAWVLSMQQNPRLFALLVSIFPIISIAITIARDNMGMYFRPWHIYLSIGHELAIGCIILLFVSFIKNKKFLFAFSALSVWAIMNTLFFGYIVAEGGWPTEDAIIAIMQTNPTEAYYYIERKFGISTFFILGAIFIAIFAMAKQCKKLSIKPDVVLPIIPFISITAFCSFIIYITCYNILVLPIPRALNFYYSAQSFKEKHTERNVSYPQILSKPFGGVYVLVIGESATRDHMHAYGYERENTPFLSATKQAILFKNAYSSYQSTIKSLAYALSAKNQYNEKPLEDMPTLIETAKAAGIKTAYISNQSYYSIYNLPISYIQDAADEKIWLHERFDRWEHFDGELVNKLDEIKIEDNMLIIFHLVGSHEPVQYRYPKEFNKYNETIITGHVNAYDNTIFYTDDVLRRLYEKSKQIPNFKAFIYFSDHGEGIDDGLEHSPSHFTWQMVRIPTFTIFSDDYKKDHKEIYETLQKNANEPFTNDLIFDMMISIMGVDIKESKESDKITSSKYNADWNRFTTMYGDKKITEDTTR